MHIFLICMHIFAYIYIYYVYLCIYLLIYAYIGVRGYPYGIFDPWVRWLPGPGLAGKFFSARRRRRRPLPGSLGARAPYLHPTSIQASY